jgi:hypothetical protein
MSSRLVVGLVAATLVCLAAPVADATPRVSFKMPPASAAGKPIRFVYTTSGLDRAQRVVVQRQRGTARVWRTALKLSRKRSASAKFPGLASDKYRLRIAALGHDGNVLAQQQRSLTVVPFSTRAASAQDQLSDRLEQERYATETMNLSYTAFLARKSDFTSNGCNANHPKPGGCRKPSPYNSFDWTTDGCSPPTPSGWKDLFDGPCQLHDFGYRNFGKGLTLGRDEDTRAWIDGRFETEMKRLCNNNFPHPWQILNREACFKEAEIMWAAVRTFNDWSKPLASQPSGPGPGPSPAPGPLPAPVNPQPPTGNPQPPTTGGTPTAGGSTPTVPAGSYAETVGGVTHTWTDYLHAGGTQGLSIQTGQAVGVSCKISGFAVANGNTWWYQVASSPWNGTYYASADAFYNNGQTSGSLLGTPFVDPNVPDCAGSSPPPPAPAPAWAETVGGVTHTWTNYSNAGGNQGPSVQTSQTVQIACKVQGFKVADGDTWWYQVASSPWNGTYYASADAFYNNGQTSGSLLGTPFVDPAVADC